MAASESLVIASEAKQSSVTFDVTSKVLDCFVAEPVIGPRDFARVRWLLAMTTHRGNSVIWS